MAELLTVVAILAILMGLVGISVFNYVRDLTLTEYDNAAKSIYIAAQNSMADLQASGEWVAKEKTYTTSPAQKREDDNSYYYISAETARTNGILPAGSIEDQVWNGDFIIEYSYETAAVFGVFYTEGGQTELEAYYDKGRGARDRDTRRKNNKLIVGYYGGADASNLDSVKLQEPVVSAGRSPILGVTDPNLATSGLTASKLVTLVTIEKAAPSGTTPPTPFKLMLNKESGGVKAGIVTDTEVVGLADASIVKMSGDLGKETTYSIDLAKLKANDKASPYLADIAAGDEYRVTARVTTTEKLCRPAYGYGTGIWPDEGGSGDVIFTSNIIADYEREADLYVYRDKVNDQADGGGEGSFVTFNLENRYNDLTAANENLYYRIVADRRITIDGVKANGRAHDLVSGKDYYDYPYEETKRISHQVTFSIPNIDALADGTTMDIKVNVYRENGRYPVAGDLSKTLTIRVRVLNQRPFGYHVEDHGSYAEVVVTAGNADTGQVTIAPTVGGVVSDESSTAYESRDSSGGMVKLKSIPAGSSVSIKYFKTDASITLDETSFTVTGPGQ